MRFSVRTLARGEITQASHLMYESFKSEHQTLPQKIFTQCAIALDLERRCTPWDWDRHRQFVAQAHNGSIIGFVELWNQNPKQLDQNTTPQPCIFNLCVALPARRSGVASALVHQCEEQVLRWGAAHLFLSVARSNVGALTLYDRVGFQQLGLRSPNLAGWAKRWKGRNAVLILMRKELKQTRTPCSGGRLGLSSDILSEDDPLVEDTSDLAVTLDRVLAYESSDALLWFFLLILRNAGSLSPLYGAVAIGAASSGIITYLILVQTLLRKD